MLFTVLNQGSYPLYKMIIAAARAFGVGSTLSNKESYLRVVTDYTFFEMFGYRLPPNAHTAILLATCNGDSWLSSPIWVAIKGQPSSRSVLAFGTGMKMTKELEAMYRAAALNDAIRFSIDTSSHKSVGKPLVHCRVAPKVVDTKLAGRGHVDNAWWNSEPTVFTNGRYNIGAMPVNQTYEFMQPSPRQAVTHFILDLTPEAIAGLTPITIVPCFVIHTKTTRRYAFIRASQLSSTRMTRMWQYRHPRADARGSRAVYSADGTTPHSIVNLGLPAISSYGLNPVESIFTDSLLTDRMKKAIKSGDIMYTVKTKKAPARRIEW